MGLVYSLCVIKPKIFSKNDRFNVSQSPGLLESIDNDERDRTRRIPLKIRKDIF